ncbi:hypothetical protein FNO01nite_02050 [Flavobacterium noncentrifugens]|uniref:Por secretion system C-terminal sorting domain-containing protein n=1 Tax=Flavobacterium noncentrifugens TaxID=1128970 RepID=A0A1G8RRY0_9FLAO|nr:T9SS type A sorting domain-containing protein [Flavobacterium noncentrifugens]GEP49533.1 hypothetical protein FNO01nite_02050 [Flavobacterium noncentrifugens]SDJ19120.1 Por secretion system C-terminal sorting domain-containing protein [Flavobacterium noncentrifugens]
MKKTLLFNLFIFCTIGAIAQAPINNFYQPQDRVTYNVVQSAVPLVQETSGANMNWNFSQLTAVGTSEVHTVAPTAEELVTYLNTTAVTVTTATLGSDDFSNKIFSRTSGTTVSITGANTSQIELIYDTDNATLGNFPLNYGFTNSDGISGTYNATGGYSGSFTGNSTTAVDAYGILTVNVGSTPAATHITRLKTTQTISLDYLFFSNVGTVTQTTYSYYKNGSPMSVPVFRSTHTNINVPLMQIDYTTDSLESFEAQLNTSDFEVSGFSIAPNPATDFVTIQMKNNEIIRNLKIVDVNGRIIIESNPIENTLDLSQLQKGTYFAQIKTDSGTFAKKIIKN